MMRLPWSGVGPAVFAILALALAALSGNAMALHAADHAGTANTVVIDGADKTVHGVLPSKNISRLTFKVRHGDAWLDHPPLSLQVIEAWRAHLCLVGTDARSIDGHQPQASLGSAHRPRGPPSGTSQKNATGSRQPIGAFGSSEHA